MISKTLTTLCHIVDHLTQPMMILHDTAIVHMNEACHLLINDGNKQITSLEAITGSTYHAFVNACKHSTPIEIELHTASNRRLPVKVSSSHYASPNTILLTLEDLSYVRALEVRLMRHERHYLAALRNTVDAFFLLEPVYDATGEIIDFRFVDINTAAERQSGKCREELLGHNLGDVFPHNTHNIGIPRYRELYNTQTLTEEEYEFYEPGNPLNGWYYHQIIPLDGALAIFNRNITERKLGELELEEKRQQLLKISNNIHGGIYRSNIDDGFVYVSDGFVRMFGYDSADEMLALHPTKLVDDPKTRHQDILSALERKDPGFSNVEVLYKRKDGSRFWGLVNATITYDVNDNLQYIDGVVIDITDVKLAQEALAKSRQHYYQLMQQAQDAVFIIDLQDNRWQIIEVNNSAKQLLGYEATDIIGQHPLRFVPQTEHPLIIETNKKISYGEAPTLQHHLIHRTGELIPIEISAKRTPNGKIQLVARNLSIHQKIRQTQEVNNQLSFQLEQEQMVTQLQKRVLSTISHEFKTPLSIIQSSADGLQRYYDRLSPERRQERFDHITFYVSMLKEMISDMSLLARGKMNEIQPRLMTFNVVQLCRTFVNELAGLAGKDHNLHFESTADTYDVLADKYLITRMLSNLLGNAIKYSAESTHIYVRVSVNARNHLVISVQDEGVGIAADQLERIFEPFYRVENDQNVVGIGLGLAIVSDCVRVHHGNVDVQSSPGVGTIFTTSLPILHDEQHGDDNNADLPAMSV